MRYVTQRGAAAHIEYITDLPAFPKTVCLELIKHFDLFTCLANAYLNQLRA